MRIEYLREFVVFSQELNVSKSARALSISQSTLSRHLIEMEREVGFDLIDRRAGYSLTSAGVQFLADAEAIVSLYDASVKLCRDKANIAEKTIVLQDYGGHPDVSARLSSLIGRFNGEGRSMTIEWRRYHGYDLAEAMLAGEIDVGQTVVHESVWDDVVKGYAAKGITVIRLYEEGIVYWMKADDPFVERGSARLSELKDYAMVMPFGNMYNPMRNAMKDLFLSRRLPPIFSYIKTWSVSDVSFARGERMACVLPPSAKLDLSLRYRSDMGFVDVSDVRGGFYTCVLFRENEEKEQVNAFRDFVLEEVSGISNRWFEQ